MKLLYLGAAPSLRRGHFYYGVAEALQQAYGYTVEYAYYGPELQFAGSIPTHHFDTWVASNTEDIRSSEPVKLEQDFPDSNLWCGAVAERSITNYSYLDKTLAYFHYPLQDLVFLVKAVALFYQRLFQQSGYDLVLAQAPDNIHSVLLFELCKSYRTPCFMLLRDYYWDPDWFYLADDKQYRSSRIASLYQKYVADYDTFVLPYEEHILEFQRHRLDYDPRKRTALFVRTDAMGRLQNAVAGYVQGREFFGIRSSIRNDVWRFNLAEQVLSWFFRSKNILTCLTMRSFSKKLPDEPFVYFPLHFQPEAVLLAAAPTFGNQLAIIQAISAALPLGYRLVVKDHPQIRGYRDPDFYRQVAALPNTILLREDYPGATITDQARLVLTIGGTAGFEALLRGTPVMIFGKTWYDCVQSVSKITDLNELPIALKTQLFSRYLSDVERDRRHLFAFLQAVADARQHRYREGAPETPDQKRESYANLLHRLMRDWFGWSEKPCTHVWKGAL